MQLRNVYNYEGQNFDIVELGAIFARLPDKFENDGDGKKAAWKITFADVIKKQKSLYDSNALTPAMRRNPAYKDQEPYFVDRSTMHTLTTVRGDAFAPRQSFLNIAKMREGLQDDEEAGRQSMVLMSQLADALENRNENANGQSLAGCGARLISFFRSLVGSPAPTQPNREGGHAGSEHRRRSSYTLSTYAGKEGVPRDRNLTDFRRSSVTSELTTIYKTTSKNLEDKMGGEDSTNSSKSRRDSDEHFASPLSRGNSRFMSKFSPVTKKIDRNPRRPTSNFDFNTLKVSMMENPLRRGIEMTERPGSGRKSIRANSGGIQSRRSSSSIQGTSPSVQPRRDSQTSPPPDSTSSSPSPSPSPNKAASPERPRAGRKQSVMMQSMVANIGGQLGGKQSRRSSSSIQGTSASEQSRTSPPDSTSL